MSMAPATYASAVALGLAEPRNITITSSAVGEMAARIANPAA